MIDDGTELFGNHTIQPASANLNGFLALAVFDGLDWGGNRDGWLSGSDLWFQELLLWTDSNHDGISQPGELKGVDGSRIRAFKLDYRESRFQDRHGNQFRYISLVRLNPPGLAYELAVDVFLLRSP